MDLQEHSGGVVERIARDGLDTRVVAMQYGCAGLHTDIATTCSSVLKGMRNAKFHLV